MTLTAAAWWEYRRAFQRTPVDTEGLARLAAAVVPGGSARPGVRLRGGIESAANAVELVDAAGAVTRAVLKRRPEPRFDGTDEWAALRAAAAATVPTPDPLGFDPAGRWFGVPALVMSRLRGRARLDIPGDPDTLRQLARALAAVHNCDGRALRETTPRWSRRRPDDTSDFERGVWDDLEASAPAAGPALALVHLDFHPANTLWSRGRLSGVIDWENGARGWPGEDLAKCRLYLLMSHGPRVADGLQAAYEAETGAPVPLRALSDISYAVGIWRQADDRAWAMRRSGIPGVTGDSIRAITRQFIDAARHDRPLDQQGR